MSAVWLSDELMVVPSAVAGLSLHWWPGGTEYFSAFNSPMRWHIKVVWVGGGEPTGVWWHDGFKAASHAEADERRDAFKATSREEAEAEMGRLSMLLWPPVSGAFVAMRGPTGPDMRIYDPELYGLAVCPAWEPDAGPSAKARHCDLADGHPGDHRWGSTFSEAYAIDDVDDPRPPVESGEPLLSNSLMGVASARARYRGFPKPPFTVRAEAAVAAVDALNAVVDGWCEGPNRQCGSMSNAGERCKLPFGHELPHVDVHGWHWSVSDHI